MSLPVPSPCSTAIGQLAYASQWIGAPGAVAEPAADEARDRDRQQQVERQRAETRATAAGSGESNGITPSSSVIGANPSSTLVTMWIDEHDDHQQRDVAVDRVDREPRPARGRERAASRAIPSTTLDGQQHERDRARAAREVPVGARSERRASRAATRHADRLRSASRDRRQVVAVDGPAGDVDGRRRRRRRAGSAARATRATPTASLAADDRRGAGDVRVQARARR